MEYFVGMKDRVYYPEEISLLYVRVRMYVRMRMKIVLIFTVL